MLRKSAEGQKELLKPCRMCSTDFFSAAPGALYEILCERTISMDIKNMKCSIDALVQAGKLTVVSDTDKGMYDRIKNIEVA